MKNFVKKGENITFLAPYDVASGAAFLVGTAFAVANYAAKAGEEVEGSTTGVYDLNKHTGTGQGFTQGQAVYWDNNNKRCTATASGNYPIGYATDAATTSIAGVRVRLNGTAILAAAE